MSYNGIGLSTARGSGTNGFVQKNIGNKSSLGLYERRKEAEKEKERLDKRNLRLCKLKKSPSLVEHELKREIEVKCAILRDKLEEDDGLDDDLIDRQVEELRSRLLTEQKERQLLLQKEQRYREKSYQSVNSSSRSNTHDRDRDRDRSPTRDEQDISKLEADNFIKSFQQTNQQDKHESDEEYDY